MAENKTCHECGLPLPENAPEELCPRCLMRVAMGESHAGMTLDNPGKIEGPGTVIGRYELLELIGEGGMGLVYLAEQKEPVRRKVALKIIKPGMDSRQVIARFEAERQTLAVLDHPNIAHVFDAGCTETGRPYFVMEHVKGMSITRYCDDNRLTIEQRLRLFEQVCEAVHHAHQKGIIHRDLKPSNILVSVHGDRATPKIIDFGIAKAITSPLTDKTFVTLQGQLLGTPEYMSPEQVDLATQDIDTRSDIYSLGVVLYELLAGVLPFESESFARAGLAEIQQTIREQEPASPSIRLTSLGEKAKTIAASRGTQAVPLARRLHRELEWILLKAMRKDRCRRYRSATEMADDIHNYLTGRPLLAGPETTIYRLQKFVHKHAGSVTMVALIAVVIVMGLVASIVMGCRAEHARRREAIARRQVEHALARAEQAENAAQEQRRKAEDLAENYRRALYFNRIALADISYRDGNIRHLREQLDACPEDLRGWEWDYLSHVSDQSVMTIRGQMGNRLAISPDGRRIAGGGSNNTVKIWDATTGVEPVALHGHGNRVTSATFSPIGKRLISGSWDNTIRVWDIEETKELMTLAGHEAACAGYFSPDGTRIVSGSRDGTLRIWDAQTGKELRSWRAHAEGEGRCHAISPDGRYIASGGSDGIIKVWDATTTVQLKVLRGHQGSVSSVKFSPDGQRIVSASMDRTAKLWEIATAKELMSLSGHTDTVWDAAFDSQGSRIASGSRDCTIKVWDVHSAKELMTLLGHRDSVFFVAFSPDGKQVFSGSRDGTIKVWNTPDDAEYPRIGDDATIISFSNDWQRIVSGERDGGITVWDRSTGARLMTLHGPEGDMISDVRFSPDDQRIFSSQIRKGTVWDSATGTEIMSFQANAGYVYAAFSPDGRYIASWVAEYWDEGQDDNAIRVRDATNGREITILEEHEAEISGAVFDRDSKRLASCDLGETVKIWDLEAKKEIVTLKHNEGAFSLAFSPDGSQIASGGSHAHPTIQLWNAQTGDQTMVLKGHSRTVDTLMFSPDGTRLVSGSDGDKTVKLWDIATGTEVMNFAGARLIAVSPDGKTIAVVRTKSIELLESE